MTAAFGELGMDWKLPHILKFGGEKLDLVAAGPPMLRKLAAKSWTAARRKAADLALRERWQDLEMRGEPHLGKILGDELDVPFLMDELRPGALPPASAKALTSILWGRPRRRCG